MTRSRRNGTKSVEAGRFVKTLTDPLPVPVSKAKHLTGLLHRAVIVTSKKPVPVPTRILVKDGVALTAQTSSFFFARPS